MTRVFKSIAIALAIFWVLAVAVLVIGIFGLFGQEQDPLSGVFLIPIGFPWIMMLDSFPEAVRFWLAVFSPGLNVALFAILARVFTKT